MNDVTPEIRDKYDRLLHLKSEANWHRDEVEAEARLLFPDFNGIDVYDSVLGAYEIECYQDARSKGLSVEESAHAAEVSNYVMTKALKGQGLSLDKFVELIKAELFARARMTTKLLGIIEKATSSTDVNAAAMLLEKISPDRYGKAVALTGRTNTEDNKEVILNFTVSND